MIRRELAEYIGHVDKDGNPGRGMITPKCSFKGMGAALHKANRGEPGAAHALKSLQTGAG